MEFVILTITIENLNDNNEETINCYYIYNHENCISNINHY